jgi:hypothetical protein
LRYGGCHHQQQTTQSVTEAAALTTITRLLRLLLVLAAHLRLDEDIVYDGNKTHEVGIHSHPFVVVGVVILAWIHDSSYGRRDVYGTSSAIACPESRRENVVLRTINCLLTNRLNYFRNVGWGWWDLGGVKKLGVKKKLHSHPMKTLRFLPFSS